ncbi:MAG TPA: 50S ribosomal protein L22 [Acidimicrobiia bacterium]|jgi:large subunit ribosomal protein L22|nr:50S ribosomal protein L22 [Acidimicrobiia bacterium]
MATKAAGDTRDETRAEARASVRHLNVSPYKVRPVLDLVRGMAAEDAERVLQLQPRTAAGHVLKVLESAIANAEHNKEIPIDELYVRRCFCDEGPTRKWGQARARGRYFRVRKRSSHLTIVLARFSDDELRARRGREESASPASASGRLARRRADRVRASRAAARGETLEEHDHDEHDHEHDEHDHEETGASGATVDELLADYTPEAGTAEDEPVAETEAEIEASTEDATDDVEADADDESEETE